MKTDSTRPFRYRTFVSLGMVITALGLPVSGIANHMLQLEPMTLPRHAWMAAHNSLGVLFLVFAVCHVVLNRRALPALSREAVCAAAVVAVLTFVAAGHAFHVH